METVVILCVRMFVQVKALAPQVRFASKMVFENPDSEAAREHYQLIKEDYQRQVEKLTKLVDSGVDPVMFLAASGTYLHLHSCIQSLTIL